jgi:hypothetical protein
MLQLGVYWTNRTFWNKQPPNHPINHLNIAWGRILVLRYRFLRHSLFSRLCQVDGDTFIFRSVFVWEELFHFVIRDAVGIPLS